MESRVRHLTPTVGLTFALAALLHLWGNTAALIGSVTFQPGMRLLAAAGVGLAAVVVLLRPWSPSAIDALAGALVAKALVDLPVTPNHQLLLALMSLSWLLARAVTRFSADARAGPMLVGGRATFLVAYGFAAFAKLNGDFFDPAVSCAVEMTDSLLGWVLPGQMPGWLATAAMPTTATIELAVPLLLVSPRTRRFGVLLGLIFHGLLALDPLRHFYDFTGAVALGLVWFLPAAAFFDNRVTFTRGRPVHPVGGPDEAAAFTSMAARTSGPPTAGALPFSRVFIAVLCGLMTLLIPVGIANPFTLWVVAVPLVAWLAWGLGGEAWRSKRVDTAQPPHSEPGQAPHPRLSTATTALVLVPALVAFANGLAPYLEVKNYGSWNMYSNLRVVDGESNHLLVGRSLPVSGVLQDRVLLADSDAGDEWPRFAVYTSLLLEGPDATRDVIEDGETTTVGSVQAADALGAIRFRLQRLAPVAAERPEPCRITAAM